jgi:hypothetical protein
LLLLLQARRFFFLHASLSRLATSPQLGILFLPIVTFALFHQVRSIMCRLPAGAGVSNRVILTRSGKSSFVTNASQQVRARFCFGNVGCEHFRGFVFCFFFFIFFFFLGLISTSITPASVLSLSG